MNDVEAKLSELEKKTNKNRKELIETAEAYVTKWYRPAILQFAYLFINDKIALGDKREESRCALNYVNNLIANVSVDPLVIDAPEKYTMHIWLDVSHKNSPPNINIFDVMKSDFDAAVTTILGSFEAFWKTLDKSNKDIMELYILMDSLWPSDRVTTFKGVPFGYQLHNYNTYKLCIKSAYFNAEGQLMALKQ